MANSFKAPTDYTLVTKETIWAFLLKMVISPCIFGKALVAAVLWQFCSGSSERFKEAQLVSNDLPWLKSL